MKAGLSGNGRQWTLASVMNQSKILIQTTLSPITPVFFIIRHKGCAMSCLSAIFSDQTVLLMFSHLYEDHL